MKTTKNKVFLGVISLVLIIALLTTLVVYIFMQSNKKNKEWELFIDHAPVNYDSSENYFHVMRFTDTANDFLSKLFNGVDATALTERVILSMSKARIPAEKLGSMATAIASIDLDDFTALPDWEISEDDILIYMQKTTMEYISMSIHKFFSSSQLTEEEFSKFLYVYLLDYAPKDYLVHLGVLGRENFIAFFSNSIYLINTLGEIKESGGANVSNYALQAVFYQLGSVYSNIYKNVGVDVLEKVLCFDWHFTDEHGENDMLLNNIYAPIQGKIGMIVGILGAVMQQIDVDTIAAIRDYMQESDEGKIKTDKQIFSQILLAKVIKNSVGKMHLEPTGIDNFSQMASTYLIVIKNMIKLSYIKNGGNEDDAEFVEQLQTIDDNMARYVDAIEYLYPKDYTLSQINDIADDDYYQQLLTKSQEMSSMKYSLDYFVASSISVWISYQAKALEDIE